MKKHLIICGHGQGPNGYDPGAINKNKNLTEADLVRRLATAMSKYSQDIEYVTDKNVYAYDNMASYRGYATVTELHLNAFNTEAKGTEVLIYHQHNADELDNKLLSVGAKYFVNRGIKKRDGLRNVTNAALAGFNYRLIEVCFIDNNDDVDTFLNNIDDIARQYVEAIENRVIAVKQDSPEYIISGSAHIQNHGWKYMYKNMIGTTGQGLRLEAFSLTVTKNGQPLNVTGAIHVQDVGDVDSKLNLFGTVGMSKRIEAIKIDVDAPLEYRVHAQDVGWSQWQKIGTWIGTKGQSKRIEAIEFRVI